MIAQLRFELNNIDFSKMKMPKSASRNTTAKMDSSVTNAKFVSGSKGTISAARPGTGA